jgi:integrase
MKMYKPVTISQYKSSKVGSFNEAKNTRFIVELTKAGNVARRWEFRYQFSNKRRKRTLIPTTLEHDRKILQQWRDLLAAGIDPLEVKSATRAAEVMENSPERRDKTFKEIAQACEDIRTQNSTARRGADQHIQRLADYAYPLVGNVPITEFNRSHVLAVIKPIWASKNRTCEKLLSDITYVWNYAISSGFRGPGMSPAQWKGNLEFDLPKSSVVHEVKHFSSMPYGEVPDLCESLWKTSSNTSMFLLFTILCGIRNGTVRQAEWDEVDFKQRIWSIPKTKNGQPWSVPLTEQMLAVLKQVPQKRGGYIFTQDRNNKKPVSENAGNVHLKKVCGIDPSHAVTHGFRASLSSYLNNETRFSTARIEQTIEHKMKDKIEAAYNRSENISRRLETLQVWNDYCWSKVNEPF